MGSRLGSIVGFLQVNDNKSGEYNKNREQLLLDYGLA